LSNAKKEVMHMAKPIYKPGHKAPFSGQYPLVGPKGGQQGIEVTVTKGESMPPDAPSRYGLRVDCSPCPLTV